MNIWSFIDHMFPSLCVLCGSQPVGIPNLCVGCMNELPYADQYGCPTCARPMVSATPCGQCLKERPRFNRTVAALLYRGAATRLIHRFKFQGDLAAGAVLANLMVRAIGSETHVELIVPVPLAKARRSERGFDQALELARMVARAKGLCLVLRGVKRVLERCPQSTLTSWEERRRNVRGVFHVEQLRLTGARVAIVDDVMTSGATANALAGELRRAGASAVHVWVACRAGVDP